MIMKVSSLMHTPSSKVLPTRIIRELLHQLQTWLLGFISEPLVMRVIKLLVSGRLYKHFSKAETI